MNKKLSGFAIAIMVTTSLAIAQPSMGPGMAPGMGQGSGRNHQEGESQGRERSFHGTEIWMDQRLHKELGLTDLQREKLKTFMEDTSNGLIVMVKKRMELQNAMVEVFNAVTIDEDRVQKIKTDWISMETKWIEQKLKATRFFFSLLSPDQKARFRDLHEKFKADRQKRKDGQNRPPHDNEASNLR
jgi:Spy/CpxP family protein refolding chaperone